MARGDNGRGWGGEVVYGSTDDDWSSGLFKYIQAAGFETAVGGVDRYWTLLPMKHWIWAGQTFRAEGAGFIGVYWYICAGYTFLPCHAQWAGQSSDWTGEYAGAWWLRGWRFPENADGHSLRCRGSVGLVTCLGRPTHPLPAASGLINTEQRTVMLTNQPARGDPLHIPPLPPLLLPSSF